MAKDDLKGLVVKLRNAAEAIKAEIGEIDERIKVVQAERETLTNASVSKADFMTYVQADIARRGELYVHRIKGFATVKGRGTAKLDPSFAHLERVFAGGRLQNFPFMNGEDAIDGFNPTADAYYWYFGGIIAERFSIALDMVFDWPEAGIPVDERRKRIEEIDGELESLVEKRDSLVLDLTSIGIGD